ncbi:MAG: XrtA system polysaccharide deacetylase [Rhodospirillales bacterium]
MLNVLTVDVEETFHATEVQASSGTRHWDAHASRVEDQTRRVLEMFAARGVRATFFVLGWVARRRPGVVREIVANGHEIGSHSFSHRLIYELTPAEFRRDTEEASDAIAQACGSLPRLYRAPSYSITAKSLWALEILVECGFTHDSSIYPISHDRYGIPGFPRRAGVVPTPSGPIFEVPIATIELSNGCAAPVGGGAYLRLLPYRYTAAGIRRINRENMPACIYFHPWELDAGQPRLTSRLLSRWRTYAGLRGMQRKVDRLLREFQFSSMEAVYPFSREAVVRAANQGLA